MSINELYINFIGVRPYSIYNYPLTKLFISREEPFNYFNFHIIKNISYGNTRIKKQKWSPHW